MARLHEYEGKKVLATFGIDVPRGGAAASGAEARVIADKLGSPTVIKIQAWVTGRKALGGVVFARTAAEAETSAAKLLGMRVGQFPVTHVLVEEQLAIAEELFVSLSVDERTRAPLLLLAKGGGSGVEERSKQVHRIACDVVKGPVEVELNKVIATLDLKPDLATRVTQAIKKVFEVARGCDARSVEINPLVITADGRLIAADCRITVDDYAVPRHPELGIQIARELDHPPTALERAAYAMEQADHRGTFYFAQMNTSAPAESKGLIGFHGAGGGGSMISMDAITAEGFTIANFCDTSGNPSPAKVYSAARVILSQPGLIGYFGSGSGVANQEQFWSAYGLAKAFWEMNLDIPAVIRLGGNAEDRAVDILQIACKSAGLPARVEAYRKTNPPAEIAARFAALVKENAGRVWTPRARRPEFANSSHAVSFPIRAGRVWIDKSLWAKHALRIAAHAGGLLKDANGTPTPTLPAAEFATKDSEMIACEVECRRDGIPAVFVEIDLPGLSLAGAASSIGGTR